MKMHGQFASHYVAALPSVSSPFFAAETRAVGGALRLGSARHVNWVLHWRRSWPGSFGLVWAIIAMRSGCPAGCTCWRAADFDEE